MAAGLAPHFHADFDALYAQRRDPRALRRPASAAAEAEARAEAALAVEHAARPDGHTAAVLRAVRGGKCAEVVLWYTHHLNATAQRTLAGPLPALAVEGPMPFPAVPPEHPLADAAETLRQRYDRQSVCLHCHYAPGPEEAGTGVLR